MEDVTTKTRAKAQADTSLCKGCRLCVGACPKDAIIPLTEMNKKGYEIIRIEEDKCIGCGQCYTICPDYVFSIE
ncbi:4Fe-4S dicluster domain-containing protein [Lactonifactor longoviformis]|uniref:2-oxoglutarate ferredoxin oxidoreductase subunit delta n=1 Tax=Lactonifactor longoviformis DSM 17459 TaxID=1122155 RepID=A0A1M4Z0U4_9CLOT|nr:4Fe-4S binding protein [Lactonifactor longoviformis]POP35019.1 4Fe-4S dicluster domain-containing protein [Lactonifactor longoviformis]SHF11674.1 2-oxoglutarate ferredoxin oxidoreductase subunit delta [Lactonifactor longoviformis DSM 17459]